MQKYAFLLALLSLGPGLHAQTIKLKLSSQVTLKDAPVVLNLAKYGDIQSAQVTIDGKEVPVQLDDLNGDGTNDELAFVTDMSKKEQKTAIVTLSKHGAPKTYPARTFAEIVLRNSSVKQKNRHDIYLSSISIDERTQKPYTVLHHHGIAFENELIALRIYMDHRQTLDLYGKFHKGLELEQTQFYPSKEQKAAGFGDDILWVGNSFGLGAMRGWDGTQPTMIEPVKTRTQRILAQGPVRTIVEMEDQGWTIEPGSRPVNMTLRYTLYAGHRDINVDVDFNRDVTPYKFSTGIINVKNSVEFSDHKGMRGCWGTDWPSSDTINLKRETVGLAIYMPKDCKAEEQPANKDCYAYVIPGQKHLHYSLAYTSDNEDFGFHSSRDWFAWMKDWRKEVDHPVSVTIESE